MASPHWMCYPHNDVQKQFPKPAKNWRPNSFHHAVWFQLFWPAGSVVSDCISISLQPINIVSSDSHYFWLLRTWKTRQPQSVLCYYENQEP